MRSHFTAQNTFLKVENPAVDFTMIKIKKKTSELLNLASIPQRSILSIVQKLNWLWGIYTIWMQLHNVKYLALRHKLASIQTDWGSCIEACHRSKCWCNIIWMTADELCSDRCTVTDSSTLNLSVSGNTMPLKRFWKADTVLKRKTVKWSCFHNWIR